MSNTKHTPGPWEAMGHGNQECTVFGSGRAVAVVRDLSHFRLDEGKANAALIVAAPELLSALETLIECLQCHGGVTGLTLDAVLTAQAKIAKAKGE